MLKDSEASAKIVLANSNILWCFNIQCVTAAAEARSFNRQGTGYASICTHFDYIDV